MFSAQVLPKRDEVLCCIRLCIQCTLNILFVVIL